MRLLGVAAVLGAFLAAVPAADARMHHPARGHRIVASGGAPLDGFTAPSGAYSFRRLKSAYSGPALRIRRASDTLETDINFLGCTGFTGCPWNEAAAVAHCAATTCTVVTWYDQSGNARDLVQTTVASQPALVLGCQNGLGCLRLTGSSQLMSSVATIAPVAAGSLSVVGRREAGGAACVFIREATNSNRMATAVAAGSWTLVTGGGNITATGAAEATWHSAIGVMSGASSLLSIDGVDTAGTTSGTAVAGVTGLLGGAAMICSEVEAVFWDGYVLTAGERAALTGNQRSFWGF